ncbi:S-adenosyl-L-methionine-dependent methyltransferase [Podospora australis]|uniref:S-adenosyl-L-methionine-dependent methyltransferase n=1 Tax=Podospora australis TaxID=1536484 RepID=A0AAN6X2A1_9PEZI|nr:S-adenosyl-L-methionine-dependent methyltransferase [Podospora australis]
MAKIKLSSWFNGKESSSSNGDAESKKNNRRSFFLSNKEPEANGNSSTPTNGTATNGTAAAPPSEMIALAQKITRETEKLEAYMKKNNLPMPSFDVDAPADFPKLPEEIAQSRQEIISATKQLGLLAHGPRESLRWGIWEFLDVLALNAINHYDIAKLFPIDSTITLDELQTKTTLDPINLARLLRLAMTNGIFREPSPGVIAHTAASRALAEDTDLTAWIGFNGEDIFPAAAHVLEALKADPQATSLTRTGFQYAFDTVDKEPMFVTFGKDPHRARRMGKAMVSLTGGEGYEPSYFVDVEKGGYDFTELDKKGGTFVDVGGSHGFICVDLAKRYKNMKFVVQDLPKTVDSAPKPMSEDAQVAERITLLAHDFFTEQVTKDADVYYFRWIMHNYSTPYAIKILKNLIPALKPGARILINDHCLREAGQENPWDERVMRRMDVVMLALLNAQERSEAEFRELFKAVDERFVFKVGLFFLSPVFPCRC